jgi:hypothetical protein
MKRFYTLILAISGIATAYAQNITMPDSAAVIRNKVKSVKVYFNPKTGDRIENLYLVYDKQGRLIREGQNENSYYYAYGYDDKNRRISYTQRSAKGEFTQKSTIEFLERDSMKKVSLYQAYDTTRPTHIYFYDKSENKVREEAYANGILTHLQIIGYDNSGEVVYSYDSTANSIAIRKDLRLIKIRSYSPKNELLHDYTYKYGQHGVTDIIDSVSPKQVTRYVVLYSVYGQVTSAERNGKELTDVEFRNFQSDFMYVLPRTNESDGEYGLPPGELLNTHKLTYDKKGNITRDELTQKQGTFSETYVYEYEYEFY